VALQQASPEARPQENDDDDANCCSGEELEVKMPLTKKPVAEAAEDRPSAAF